MSDEQREQLQKAMKERAAQRAKKKALSDAFKGPGPPGLYRMPVGGGEEKQVLPAVAGWGTFGVATKGVYFMTDERTVRFLDTPTR
jgi:hypothetical protein